MPLPWYQPHRQASRALRLRDRSNPNSLIGVASVPFDDGTVMDVEFYKPAEYKHNGIFYEVIFSVIIRRYHGAEENAPSDVKVNLVLKKPNDEEEVDLSFNITNYGSENQVIGQPIVDRLAYDAFVENEDEASQMFSILYEYGIHGVVNKDNV